MRPLLLAALLALAVPTMELAPAPTATLGVGHGALHSGSSVSNAVAPTSYGALTTISGPGFSGEPDIAVASDGTTYATGLGWQGGTLVYRRLPGESGFTYLGQPDAPYGGNDEALAVGPDDSVWIAGLYGFFDNAGSCVSVTRSTTHGASWQPTVPRVCSVHDEASRNVWKNVDRQWIAVDGDGTAWILEHEACCVGVHDVYRSTDGGVTFAYAGIATPAGGFPGNLFAARAQGWMYEATSCAPDGTKFAVCVFGTPTSQPLPVWAPRGVIKYASAPAGLAHVTGAADAAGNLYVAFVDKASSDARAGVYVARSTDGGATWSAPARVSSAATTAVMPWISAGGDGNIAVVWDEATTPPSADPNTVPSSASWNVESAIVRGWRGAAMPTPTLAQLSTAPNHVGQLCTQGASCSGHRQLLDFFEATIGADGALHVVWPDDANGFVWRVADVSSGLR